MKKILTLFLLIIFASIVLPVQGADSFDTNIVEEEILAKKKIETNRNAIFRFPTETLLLQNTYNLHYCFSVTLVAKPYLSVPSQPPNF